MATQQQNPVPGTFFRIFDSETKLATAVFTKHGKYLQVDPKPLVHYSSLDDWKSAFPTQTHVDMQTPKERDEARKAWKAEQQAKKIAEQTPDIAKIRALYEFYGIPNSDKSSVPRIFVELDGQMMAIYFHRSYNSFTVSLGKGCSNRHSVQSFAELMKGQPTRFWYKPNEEIMVLAETDLVPKPDQKIVYLTFYRSIFSKQTIIDRCANVLKAKGYFVYLQERGLEFERKMYNLKKENSNVVDVIECNGNQSYTKLSDFHKKYTKNILEWF